MSLFNDDIAKEALLGKFLSAHYLKNNLKAQRIYDKASQCKGIDLMIEGSDGIHYKVDEKAQLHYLNEDLPTFALEISYLKDSIVKQGWLFDPSKETEIYAFVFSIHLASGKTELTDENDIESCEVIFVNRAKLKAALAKLKIGSDTCISMSEKLRSSSQAIKLKHFPSGFNFQVSDHLSEIPVNLIVRKTFLKQIGKCFIFRKQ